MTAEQELTNKCIHQALLLGRMMGLVCILMDELNEHGAITDQIQKLYDEIYNGTESILYGNTGK